MATPKQIYTELKTLKTQLATLKSQFQTIHAQAKALEEAIALKQAELETTLNDSQ